MENNFFRNIILIVIIFLVVIIGFNSKVEASIEYKSFYKNYSINILYVGGTGEGNYSSIQDAINNSMNGYKIFDYQDNYLGSNKNFLVKNLILNKTYGIYLKGSSYNTISQNLIKDNNFGIKITQDDYPTAPTSYCNLINKNVFIRNDKNAFDEYNNRWKFNYWDDWIGLKIKLLRFLPYRIPGTFLKNLDWKLVDYPNNFSKLNTQEVIYDKIEIV